VDDIDETLEELGTKGAQLGGEVVRYKDAYRLCYFRGPEDGFGKQRDNSITTGFGGSFQFDDVLKIAVFDREVCFTRMARLPSNLPARALEESDELALIFLFGFASLRHIVMAMVMVMALTIPRCRAICHKYNMLHQSLLPGFHARHGEAQHSHRTIPLKVSSSCT
jgi:hypothetical protein